MLNELLILVDETALDEYKGVLESLKKSYAKWGFRWDESFDSLTFRGNFSILKDFKDFHMEYFDEYIIFS